MDVKDAGQKGGKATLQKYGKDHFKKISQAGVEARKKKKIALLTNQAIGDIL